MIFMLGVFTMEIDYNNKGMESSLKTTERADIIKVRAIISCPTCSYEKKFKNQFPRDQLELMTVAIRIFDWMTCNTCGNLLDLSLEFNI